MGKVYKRKKRSCKLCKPHKMGIAKKNKKKILDKIERTDKEIKDAIKHDSKSI